MSSIPVRTELVEVPKPALVDARFNRLSANGAGSDLRFDRLSENGILGRERWVGTAANGLNVNPVRTELVEGLEHVLVGVRFDKLSANGAGRSRRFDRFSANGAGSDLRFDRLSANGALKVPLAGRKAMG
jgi:hypothetical protein